MTYATLMYLTGGVDPGSLGFQRVPSNAGGAGEPRINSINSPQFFLGRTESLHFKLVCKEWAFIFCKA